MGSQFEYGGESPFWYFLGHRAVDSAKEELPLLADSLNERSSVLSLPIHYPYPHALAWAVLCQLFSITQPHAPEFGITGFRFMLVGFDRVFSPKGRANIVFSRIMANIRQPAFLGRTRDQSIVDTFLAGALKLINESEVDPALDPVIIETCLSDPLMVSIGTRAVTPPAYLWEDTVAEYRRRRPGFFKRDFSNSDRWLFD